MRSVPSTSIATASAANDKPVSMVPRPTYPVRISTHTHTANSTGTAAGHSTAMPPITVAAPLPPRKPCHTGHTWPMAAANAAA